MKSHVLTQKNDTREHSITYSTVDTKFKLAFSGD